MSVAQSPSNRKIVFKCVTPIVLEAVPKALRMEKAEVEGLVGGSRHDIPPEVYWVRVTYLLSLADKLQEKGASLHLVSAIEWEKIPYTLSWKPGVELGVKVDEFGNRHAARNPEVQMLRETWLQPVRHDDPAADA